MFNFASLVELKSGVTTSLPPPPLLHRVDQIVDCGLWNVGPLLVSGCKSCWILAETGTCCRIRQCRAFQTCSWHVRWFARSFNNWNAFSFLKLCTYPCIIDFNMTLSIIKKINMRGSYLCFIWQIVQPCFLLCLVYKWSKGDTGGKPFMLLPSLLLAFCYKIRHCLSARYSLTGYPFACIL